MKAFGYYRATLQTKVSPLRTDILKDLATSIKDKSFDINKEIPLFRSDIAGTNASKGAREEAKKERTYSRSTANRS